MTRVGYVILSHGDTRHLERLVRRLRPHAAAVVVHYDAKEPTERFDALRRSLAADDVLFAPRVTCRWGGFSIVAATLGALNLLLATTSCDRVCLLSGSHYPVVDPARIPEFFTAHADREFLFARPMPDPRLTPNGGMNRIEFYYPLDGTGWVAMHVAGVCRRAQSAVGHRRRLPRGARPSVGSQWWCLSEPCLRSVLESPAFPRLVRFFRRTMISDESFFQTLVSNSPWADRVAGRTLTYAAWDPPSPHPRVLTDADLPAVLESGNLFARKFDADASTTLADRLDDLTAQPRPMEAGYEGEAPSPKGEQPARR